MSEETEKLRRRLTNKCFRLTFNQTEDCIERGIAPPCIICYASATIRKLEAENAALRAERQPQEEKNKNMLDDKPVSDHTETREATTVPVSGTHTPGPWVIDREQFSSDEYEGIHAAIRTKDHWFIAEVCAECGHPNDESEANTRLIAAAPDLLEALRGLHDDIAEYARINHLGGFDNHWMRFARAALAKADTGNPPVVAGLGDVLKEPMTKRYLSNLRRRQALRDEGLCIDCMCGIAETHPLPWRCPSCRKHATELQTARRRRVLKAQRIAARDEGTAP